MMELDLTTNSGSVLALVPHEDDEIILFGGLIARCVSRGVPVTVALATNGDCGDTDGHIGRARLQESIASLHDLGLLEERVVFLGYADTGMPESDSFLAGLYTEPDGARNHPSHVGTHTYGLPSHPDFHTQRTGEASAYTRDAFVSDLLALFDAARPNAIFTTHPCDAHGDHAALYRFVRELAPAARVYAGFAHSAQGDTAWPLDGDAFTCPPECKADWARAVRLTLTAQERAQKRLALFRHTTALKPDAVEYLYRFIKSDEVYFPMEATI